jgi:hypothetical protein
METKAFKTALQVIPIRFVTNTLVIITVAFIAGLE